MNNRLSSFLTALICLSGISYYAAAQDETDALRGSFLSTQGTARSIGFGGALGSIGGDFSSLSVNPGGIGVYRGSEFTFTPAMKINSDNSTYQNVSTTDNKSRLTIANFGFVFTSSASGKRYTKNKWKTVSFGIGANRVADFNRNYTYKGYNNTSSGAEIFGIDAVNNPSDITNTNTLAGLGYETYLIDTYYNAAKGNRLDYATAPYWTTGLNQQRSVKEKGGITEYAISLGGNYMEKLMMGATLGIPSLVYKREATYTESDATNDPDNGFNSFVYRESLVTRGSGINLKLGVIYKANDAFRFGVALHTPTYFNLKDVYNRSLTANTENKKKNLGDNSGPVTRVDAAENNFEYGMLTPWRAVLSAAGIIGKHGFITADYEFVNYAATRFNFDLNYSDYETFINQKIKNTYKAASNVRVGAEGRFDVFMVRVGAGYYGSPYKNSYSGADRFDFSAGLGLRTDNWFLDLGIVHSMYTSREQPYSLDNPYLGIIPVPSAAIKNNLNNVAVTFGTKF